MFNRSSQSPSFQGSKYEHLGVLWKKMDFQEYYKLINSKTSDNYFPLKTIKSLFNLPYFGLQALIF